MVNILITGGAGFIGSTLAIHLNQASYNIRVLDNLNPQIHGDPEKSFLYQSIKNKVDFIKGDVRNSKDLKKSLDGIDVLIHLAAETGTGQSMYEIEKYVDVNVLGTAKILDHIINKKNNLQKVIVASSRAVYGEGKYYCQNHGIIYPNARVKEDMINGNFDCKCSECGSQIKLLSTDENSKIHPSSVYGITKYNQEALVMKVGCSIGLPIVVMRYQNVYGPGQSLKNPYTGILSIFSQLILSGKAINVFEDGKESRDFVHINDVVKATRMAIESNKANFQIFNVGSGKAVSVNKIVNLLKKYYHSNAEVKISGDFRIGDIRHNFADIKNINERLQFTPEVFFEQGLKSFTSWVKTQQINISDQNFQKSLKEMSDKNLFHTSS